MSNLNSYNGVVAYLKAYFLGDPRVKSILIGPHKRVLNAQRSTLQHPFVWIEDISFFFVADKNDNGPAKMWDVVVSIRGNASETSAEAQDARLREIDPIMTDFLLHLWSEKKEAKLEFTLHKTESHSQEDFEADNNYGWTTAIALGARQKIPCPPLLPGHGEVIILVPNFLAAGDLALDIDGNVIIYNWSITMTLDQVLAKIAFIINQTAIPNVSAEASDGVLFVINSDKDNPIQDLIDVDPVENAQDPWLILF